jgi:hypothetical protein
MLNEEKITKVEFCVRVQIPTTTKREALPEDEHKRIALETFENQFATNAKQELHILSQPLLTSDEAVSFVFGGYHENPELSHETILELEKQFKADYFDTLPVDWKPFYLYTRGSGASGQFSLQ